MKMTPEHYSQLRDMILALDLDIPALQKEYAELQMPQQFFFDLLWRIPRPARQAWFDDNRIYSYLNDDHIRTALKTIAREAAQ